MSISLIESELVNSLSEITGEKLEQHNITPQLVFVASLIVVLLGVILADGMVTDREKQKFLEILDRFDKPENDIQRFKYLMIKGVKNHQLYRKFNELVKITNYLSDSERLLLIGLGYEMSTIDGRLGLREQRYLEIFAQAIGVKPEYFAVLASAFKSQENFDIKVINEVDFLLNSLRYQGLNAQHHQELNTQDIKQFSNDLKALSGNYKNKTAQPRVSIYYEGLKKFQKFSKQLSDYCEHIFQIVQDCYQLGFIAKDLINEVSALSQKLQSHRFRLAIIGEFSQGKSTLINALLGEEIQPMQEIPYTGTVVILKHGSKKRIVFHYKDGKEEEITFDDYRQKVSISQTAVNEEIAQSAIEEIVVEHPNLALCNSGVEIIDSPGLNENPQLTAITQKLLLNIDAAIFVTNASRPLTQSERELLNQLRIQLNGSKDDEPANNLFIICNFMDLISSEKNREQIKERIHTIVEGSKPIITGKNRIHFISAQAALNAVMNEDDNDYRKSFNNFVKSLEKFLVIESGRLKFQPLSQEFNQVIKKIIREMNKFKDELESKINVTEDENQKIIEQIGSCSGRDVKITLLTIQLIEQALEQANNSWDEWNQGLEERMLLRSEQWHSEHKLFWKQDKLIRDYIQCFVKDLSDEIDDWVNNQLKDVILHDGLLKLNMNINYELDAIKADFDLLDMTNNTRFSQELKLSINNLNEQLIELNNIDFAPELKGELLAFTRIGFMPSALANLTGIIVSSIGSMMQDNHELYEEIKLSVLETGLEKFDESLNSISEKLQENIEKFFDTKAELVSRVIEGAIDVYEKILEQQEKSHQEMLEQYYATKSHILDKCKELEQVNNKISKVIELWYSKDINKVIIKTENNSFV